MVATAGDLVATLRSYTLTAANLARRLELDHPVFTCYQIQSSENLIYPGGVKLERRLYTSYEEVEC